MKAWHFAGSQMRDGTQLGAPGEIETYDGPLEMCESGLHASERLLDALNYAPGLLLRRVEMSGRILCADDKLVATDRRILWECDMAAALRVFSRKCALDVAHLWDMPPLVREYLMTGREDIRAAAGDAARAAWAAAWAAAWDAGDAGDAADAARAAWAAAWDAGDAARAAWAAAWAAAWDAGDAGDAAWDAQERRLVAYAQAARAGLFHA